MHTPGGYYHTKTPQWPLLDERTNSQYAPPCIPVSTTTIRSNDSHANCYQLCQYQQQQQQYQYQYPQSITPSGHISGKHRLSATVCYQQGPESALHCPKKYYPVSSTTAAYMEEERPGSYSQRRRGGSVSGNSSNGSSTVNSPTLLKTHGDYYQTEPPAHQLHQKCGWYASSTLQRNNTTKTVTQNDLDADCKALGTRGRQDRRLSTPRSISYGRQLSQGHAYCTPLSLPATPEGDDVANTPEIRYYKYPPPLPLAQGDIRSSISSMTTIAASADKAGIKSYDSTDDMHIINGLTPSVNKPGNQYAYLPPRSKNLAITN
ncbi:hypothetical protein GGF37_001655 [Kickxella alabastrina]|nr:hypothetical protein GGF37_001655 [Kickxella alabastrina]